MKTDRYIKDLDYPLDEQELTLLITGAKWIADYPNRIHKNPIMLREMKLSIIDILKKIN